MEREELKDMLNEVLELVEAIAPNDVTFLKSYPELKEEINIISNYTNHSDDNTDKLIEKIKHCLCFIDTWFPDSWSEDKQKELEEAIERISNYIAGEN